MVKKPEFVAALAAEVRKSKFPSYVKQSAEEIATELEKDGKVFISAELSKGKPPRGGSKVGGRPDLPAKFKWPTEGEDADSPLQFLAQVNLADVHPHDFGGKLPAKGMVWFFSIADGDRAYGGEIDDSTTAVLFSAEPGPVKPRDLPEEFADNEDAEVEERKLDFGPTVSLRSFSDAGITEVIKKALRKLGGRSGPVDMLSTQEDRVVLADLDGYAIAQHVFGEGFLTFALSAKALARGDLAKATVEFESGS